MVLQIASSVLADDGLAVIQIRYDDGSKSVRQKYGAYFQNAITFTSYKIEAFWQLLSEKGLMPLAVTLFPETNYATYLAKKRVD